MPLGGSSQLSALGREVNGHSHKMFCNLHLAMPIYRSSRDSKRFLSGMEGGGSPQLYYHDCSGRIPGHTDKTWNTMDSAIQVAPGPDHHSASAEGLDSSSVLLRISFPATQ